VASHQAAGRGRCGPTALTACRARNAACSAGAPLKEGAVRGSRLENLIGERGDAVARYKNQLRAKAAKPVHSLLRIE
jgi:hypothetical protein